MSTDPMPAPRPGEDEFEGPYRGANGLSRGLVWSDLVAEMNAERRSAPHEAPPVPASVLERARRRSRPSPFLDEHTDEERAA